MVRTPLLIAVSAVTVALMLLGGFAACAVTGTATPQPTVTVTVSGRAPDPTGPASALATDSAAAVHLGPVLVPDVVGMVHQDAQKRLVVAGLTNLDEQDATGRGRPIIIDTHWRVVRQVPPAGSRIASDTRVLLLSVKIGE